MPNTMKTRRLPNVAGNGDIVLAAPVFNTVLDFGVGTTVAVAPTGFPTVKVSEASYSVYIRYLPAWVVGEPFPPPEFPTGVLTLPPAVTVTRPTVTVGGTSLAPVVCVTAAAPLVFVGYGP